MKTTLKNKIIIPFIFLLFLFQSAIGQVTSQDPTSLIQDINIKINNLGDAQEEVSQQMTQTQWEYFRQSPLMTDVSIVKRNIENAMATYDIEDFKRDIDEVNRTSKISITVKAYAQYDGNGNWEVKTDLTNPHIDKVTDKEYMYTGNTYMGNDLVQQNNKLFFPAAARDVQQTIDEFGKTKFTYKLGGGTTSYMSWNNILGVLLILSAIFFFFWKPKTAHVPPIKQ